MQTALHTPVCDLLGCTYPVLLAGMGGPSRSELVAAVTNAGGFGFLGMVRESPELITTEIAKVREQAQRDIESAGKAAKQELRRYAAEQSVQFAEQLIRREMKPEDDARLISRNIEELGGAPQ